MTEERQKAKVIDLAQWRRRKWLESQLEQVSAPCAGCGPGVAGPCGGGLQAERLAEIQRQFIRNLLQSRERGQPLRTEEEETGGS